MNEKMQFIDCNVVMSLRNRESIDKHEGKEKEKEFMIVREEPMSLSLHVELTDSIQYRNRSAFTVGSSIRLSIATLNWTSGSVIPKLFSSIGQVPWI
jgi:hypothetical protein